MNIDVFQVSIPYITDPISDFYNSWDVQLYVKVSDGENYGWGETLVAGSGIISAYSSVISDLIKPFIEEYYNNIKSLQEIESVLEKVMFTAGNCGVVTGAISSVEMALWALRAKQLKIKLTDLLGGKVRDSVKVYASFPRFSKVSELVKAVDTTFNRGFEIIKLHQSTSTVLDSLRSIRDKYKELKLAIDLNAPFDLTKAVEFVNKVARYEVEWVEEPLYPPNDYDTLSKLVKVSPIPISAGENEYTLHGFKKLLEAGISYLQPDVAKIGGISKFLQVLNLASAYNVKVLPHDRPDSSPISLIYTLNLALTNLNVDLVEYTISDFPSDLFPNLPVFKRGYVIPSEDIEINEEVLRKKYKYINRLRVLHFSDLEEKMKK
ncbi:mandelate racemase [Sulfolobus sp. A20]|uniref:mandelate racemase/muconate lactonizing enzyme family protein n=1 Tax=Saccharolobus sp. A20 TaxID=1891280 RepID=UPI000845F30D|nr:mandelate racemase/muconate lactonizing enzyme family protein [Sulfolobus sp. A20]TRM77739.1 mandelate racemase/muconate lactonizing enzyme family protein [Sulfolobus sp. B5]TRM78103.1 mandelate racemase/muconate lactonizing enzyme family protein [Sulfolobus sp. A20-N-F8]TRM82422.1 mandelate racemase/muconate lactonizing enzyme family protein [Sulfolobus sp. D5]TRM88797.1 mandelate racemase/muconate lactonizing enzyme family protein [Sulfolobus sp. C3]TRN00552.1 mandelate racemase/muconate 